MATGAAYLTIRRQRAKRLLDERVDGVQTERRDDGAVAVVDSETGDRLATLETCQAAAEPGVDLSFTPQTRVEYRTDTAGTAATKLRRIRERLTAGASEWRW